MAESLRQVLCFQVGHDRRDSSFDSGKQRSRQVEFGEASEKLEPLFGARRIVFLFSFSAAQRLHALSSNSLVLRDICALPKSQPPT
jgi:hypothetical protein